MFARKGLRNSCGEGGTTCINKSLHAAATKRCSREKINTVVQQIRMFCPIKVENCEIKVRYKDLVLFYFMCTVRVVKQ